MRQIAVLSGLLAVALGASYMTWTAEDSGEQDAESIVLLQADKADLVRLNWKTDTVNAAISNRSDQQGEYLWVEVTSEIEVPVEPAAEPDEPTEEAATEGDAPADGEVAEAEVEEPTPQTRMETRKGAFKGNKSANGLWDKFTPLLALRELEAGASGDSVFGFDQPYGTLEVVRKSGPTTLVVGGETYGAKDRYVKLDGRIYLVDDKVFRSLDKPESGLIDRLVQPNLEREMASIRVSGEGQNVVLEHRNKDDASASFWAPAGGEELGTAATLVGNLSRLRVSFYPAAEEIPATEARFTLEVNGDNGTYQLQFSSAGDKWFVFSSYNRAVVEVVAEPAVDLAADV